MTRPARWGCLAATAGLLLLMAAPATAAGTPAQRTWNFDQVHVPAARSAGQFGAGVTVAVLDSWVDATHPDFEGRVLAGADCVGGTCRPGPASPDQCDHGTHVAGTVASSSFGVAPRARILPVRVLTYDPSTGNCVGQPTDVAAGIRWAVAHGARVLNLSLGPDVPGLSSSTAIPSAVSQAARDGAVVVFSAGNTNLPVANSYGSDALVVTATGPSGQLASYSQRGTGVDLAAPGGDPKTKGVCTQADCITSLYPGDRYAVAAGTSMAASHVSGIAALLLGQDPNRTRTQVIARLEDTAHPLAQAGHGLVDAAAALGVSETTTRSTAAPVPIPVVQQQHTTQPASVAAPAPRASAVTSRPAAPRATSSPQTTIGGAPAPVAAPAAPQRRPADTVPVPLLAVAGGLLVTAAGSVGVAARSR